MEFKWKKTENCFAEARTYEYELPITGEIPNASNIPEGCRFHTRCIYAKDECKKTVPKLENINDKHSAACLFAD